MDYQKFKKAKAIEKKNKERLLKNNQNTQSPPHDGDRGLI